MPFQRDNLRFPKVELHLHLDGSVRLETMLEIAKAENLEMPAWTVPELHTALGCGTVRETLGFYVVWAFGYTCSVMQTAPNLTRVTRELVEDLGKEGVDYAEIRFCPMLHLNKGLTPEAVVEATLEGLKAGHEAGGPECGLIICDMRHFKAEEAGKVIDLALKYQDHGVVAVDLAGDDLTFAALDHAEHFRRAKAGGLHVTIHAGEAGSAEGIRQALDLFGAERIGHGTKLINDPTLLEEVRKRGIGIESSLTSNRQTKAWADYATHPAKEYLKRGILVSLNSDNRLLGDTSVTNEYEQAREAWDLTIQEEMTLAHNAVLTAFCGEETRARLLAIK
jgi:adenosine deaminase